MCRFLTGLYGGRFREPGDDFERRYREALGREAPGWVTGNLVAMAGMLRRIQGRPETAARGLREGSTLLAQEGDLLGFISVNCAELAHVLALSGDQAGAEEALAEYEELRIPEIRPTAGFRVEARVWVAAAGGELSRAVCLALGAGRRARGDQPPGAVGWAAAPGGPPRCCRGRSGAAAAPG